MGRNLKWVAVAALAAVVAVSNPLGAQVSTTVVTKSGERHTGTNLTFRVDRGQVTLRTSASAEPRLGVGDVAYVEFANMPANVNVSLNGSEEAVVLRDGNVVRGQMLELGTDPATNDFLVIIRDTGGQERRYHANQVARVYFAGGAAAPAATTGTGGQPSTPPYTGGGIVVSARQDWTATGIRVRRGETIEFNTTGQIQLSSDTADVAGSAGSRANRAAPANAPMPGTLAGALIARVDNGRPFPIGDQTRVQMPAEGQLYLGINDDHVNDNSGEFRVEIRRASRR